jgi:hypothetical protein
LIAVFFASVGRAVAQEQPEPTPADTVAPADSVALADSLNVDRWIYPEPITDPRITLLGDTLGTADTLKPRFTELAEIYPDSLIDPYTLARPGAWPAWVLSGDQLLGRGAFSLLDVIESEGFTLGQDMGGSGLSTFVGSSFGSHTNIEVMIDGVPVGEPLSVSWDLRRIAIEGIAKVAWYPGPQSAAWGSSATGGVLAITTRRSLTPSSRSMLAFTAGSFKVETFSGNFGRSITRRGDVFLGANFDATDGFLRIGDFTRNQFVTKLGWRIGSKHRVEVSRLSDGFSGDASRTNLSGFQDQDGSVVHLFYAGSWGDVGTRFHYARSRQEFRENFDFRDAFGLVGKGEREGFRGTIDLRRGPLLVWAAGAQEELDVESLHPAFVRVDQSSVFEPVEDDPEAPMVENPRRQIEWGGGVGWGEPDGRYAANAAVRRLSFGDAAESGMTWQFEALGRPHPELTVRLAGGRAVRPASFAGQALLVALAAEGVEIHPGKVAMPEQLEAWSGVRGEVAWTRAGWKATGRVFTANGDEAFLWLPPTAWLYFDRADFDNSRLAEIGFNTFDVVDLSVNGFEGEVTGPLPWGLRGRFVARRLDTTEDESGDRVPYVPKSQFLGQARYARRLFPSGDLLLEARVTGRFNGERTTLTGETLSSYFVTDLLVQGTIINFTIFLSLKNLTNEVFRTEEAFFLPGREGFFGINWRFRN